MKKGVTLIEMMIVVGILGVVIVGIYTFLNQSIFFWQRGTGDEPAVIVRRVLWGDPQSPGLVNEMKELFSIYDAKLDAGTPNATLGTNTIIMGYGICDSNGTSDTTCAPSDVQLIDQGSRTAISSDEQNIYSIPVVSPGSDQILGSLIAGDDYRKWVVYEFRYQNGKGTLTRCEWRADTTGINTFGGTQTIEGSSYITDLRFNYFNQAGIGLNTGTPIDRHTTINQIRTIFIDISVDKDDDKDGKVAEDWIDGLDNDSDGMIDEDFFNGLRMTTRVFPRNLNLNP